MMYTSIMHSVVYCTVACIIQNSWMKNGDSEEEKADRYFFLFHYDLAHSVGLLHLLSTCAPQDANIPQELSEAVDFYKNDLPNPVMFPIEFRMRARKQKMECQSHNSEVP